MILGPEGKPKDPYVFPLVSAPPLSKHSQFYLFPQAQFQNDLYETWQALLLCHDN